MPLSLTPMDPSRRDRAELIALLTTNVFPFHVRSRLTAADVERAIDDGVWHGDDTEAYWLDGDRGRVGPIRLDDLGDATALIDLRLAEVWRGRGFGTDALALARDRVFSTRPNVLRFEGQTREDDLAMRPVFERCGWVCEAYYRDGWPVEGAESVASVAYSVLRRDQVSGSTTPVPSTLTRLRVQDTDALVAAAWAAEERLVDPAAGARRGLSATRSTARSKPPAPENSLMTGCSARVESSRAGAFAGIRQLYREATTLS